MLRHSYLCTHIIYVKLSIGVYIFTVSKFRLKRENKKRIRTLDSQSTREAIDNDFMIKLLYKTCLAFNSAEPANHIQLLKSSPLGANDIALARSIFFITLICKLVVTSCLFQLYKFPSLLHDIILFRVAV